MLILTRKIGEAIIIGDEISIKVLGIKDNQARIGINAPLSTPVNREEIYLKMKSDEAHRGAYIKQRDFKQNYQSIN